MVSQVYLMNGKGEYEGPETDTTRKICPTGTTESSYYLKISEKLRVPFPVVDTPVGPSVDH